MSMRAFGAQRRCLLTCLLIDAYEWNASTRSPGRNLADVVHETLQSRGALTPVIFLVLDYDTQMLGELLEVLDIVGYEFGRAVVVFEQRYDFAAYETVCAPEAEEDTEEKSDQMVDGEVDQVLHRSVFSLDLLRGALAVATGFLFRHRVGGGGRLWREERVQQLFALFGSQLLSPNGASAERGLLHGRNACGSHCWRRVWAFATKVISRRASSSLV